MLYIEFFYLTELEQRFYDLVSYNLQANKLDSLPTGQRNLITLILRKLLASLTYSILDTLEFLANNLENNLKNSAIDKEEDIFAFEFKTYFELKDE